MLSVHQGLLLAGLFVVAVGGPLIGRTGNASHENRTLQTELPPVRPQGHQAHGEKVARACRRTPIVEAVDRVRAGVLTIRVIKPTSYGGRREVVGTGIIVDERGYAITNYHVIRNSTSIRIELADGSRLNGEVYASEPNNDLAILKIQSSQPLQALRFGPGSDLMVGETVIAVGHPLGFTNTVSTGIISALGREIDLLGETALKNLIQTNASINQGNSGGPLLNINGEVIGINVALREGAQGIAFALNADDVVQTLARTLSAARVAGVQHGLRVQEIVHGDGPTRGTVLLKQVAEGSSAEVAGFEVGDTLIRLGKHEITNLFDVERAFWDSRSGQEIQVTLRKRDGEEVHVPFKVRAETVEKKKKEKSR